MYLAVLALAGSIVPPTLSAPIDDRYCLFSLTAGPLLISGIPLGSLVGPQDPKDSKCPKTKVFPHTTCSRSRMHQNQDSRWTATTAHTCQCQPKGPLQTTTSISTFPLSIPNTTNTQINLHPQRHLQHPQMHLKHSQMHPQHPSMHLKHSQMHPQHPQMHSRTPQDHTEANKETHPPAAQAVLAVRHSAGATRVRSRLSSNGPMPDASGDTQRWRGRLESLACFDRTAHKNSCSRRGVLRIYSGSRNRRCPLAAATDATQAIHQVFTATSAYSLAAVAGLAVVAETAARKLLPKKKAWQDHLLPDHRSLSQH